MVMTLPLTAEQAKARIVIVATGGTIAGSAESTTAAGYKSGAVAVDMLIAAVPQMKKFADVTGVQVSSVGSQDMNDEIWIKLATEVNRLLATAGRRRHRDHARHRHDGGDGVLPEPRRQERQAGRADRLDAAVDLAERRRPAEHLQRRRRRLGSAGQGARRARRRQRRHPRRARDHQAAHDRRRDVRLAGGRADRRLPLRRPRVLADAGARAHHGDAVQGRRRAGAAARGHHLRARRHVARPDRRRGRQRREGARHRRRRRRQHDDAGARGREAGPGKRGRRRALEPRRRRHHPPQHRGRRRQDRAPSCRRS